MERKIGEIFEYNGEWYQCVNQNGCCNCAFYNAPCFSIDELSCDSLNKKRKERYIFKKLEKVGGTVTVKGRTFQKLTSDNNSCKECVFNVSNKACCKNSYIEGICDDNGFWIEIKQTKEDMEEKKPTYEELLHYYHSTVGLWAIDRSPQEVSLDWICDNAFQLGIDEKDSNSEKIGKNLKPFDLEAAKSGKPVCTRDGRKARIICFDSKNDPQRPIIALVENNSNELLYEYTIKGKDRFSHISTTGTSDLMMLPEKKEGWVNIDKGGSGKIAISSPYSTKEEAIYNDNETTIDTIKISWEE